jgi:hypothetical protein
MKRLAHTWRGNLLLSVCFFFTARSFPSPLSLGFFALDPTPQKKKKDPIRSRKKFHSDAIILQPTKKRRFINAHFWLKNGDFSRRVCKSGED